MTTYHVPDMSCGHCKTAIEEVIGAADATAKLEFDMDAREVRISSALSEEEVTNLLRKEGYPSAVLG